MFRDRDTWAGQTLVIYSEDSSQSILIGDKMRIYFYFVMK